METIKKYYVKEEKDEIKKNFLIIPEKFKKYIESDETIYWIYKISNNLNKTSLFWEKLTKRRCFLFLLKSFIGIKEYCRF